MLRSVVGWGWLRWRLLMCLQLSSQGLCWSAVFELRSKLVDWLVCILVCSPTLSWPSVALPSRWLLIFSLKILNLGIQVDVLSATVWANLLVVSVHLFELLAAYSLVQLGTDVEARFTYFESIFAGRDCQIMTTWHELVTFLLVVNKSHILAECKVVALTQCASLRPILGHFTSSRSDSWRLENLELFLRKLVKVEQVLVNLERLLDLFKLVLFFLL